MSQIGVPAGNQALNNQTSLQLLQQYQALQRQQQLAQAMAQHAGQQNMTTPNSGLASAGQNVLAGVMGANNQAQMQQLANGQSGLSPVNVTPNQATGMGGSNSMLQNAGAYLGNIFGFGSGVGS